MGESPIYHHFSNMHENIPRKLNLIRLKLRQKGLDKAGSCRRGEKINNWQLFRRKSVLYVKKLYNLDVSRILRHLENSKILIISEVWPCINKCSIFFRAIFLWLAVSMWEAIKVIIVYFFLILMFHQDFVERTVQY